MSDYFKPYEGKRPYLFISYSHRDSREVLETITLLHSRKLRLWYDEGIPAGSDWPKNIEEHMQSCSMVLFFVSEAAMASPNCRSEVQAALALNKPLFILPLKETQSDEEWRTLLLRGTILSSSDDARTRAETVLSCKRITRAYYRKPFENMRFDWLALVFALLLFSAAATGLYALVSGRLDSYFLPAPPSPSASGLNPSASPTPSDTLTPTATPYIPELEKVTFPDTKQETAVRNALNRPDGDITLSDLGGVTELHFCGTMVLEDLSDVTYLDGTYSVNSAKPITGPVSDLSVIGRMPYLAKLSLVMQPVQSLEALERLVLLNELSIAGCENTDLSTLPVLPSLQILHLEHSNVRDLTELTAQPTLKTVTVSIDMLPLSFPDDAAFDVILVP